MDAPASTLSLPIFNLADFEASGETRTRFLADLRRAAREVGFFYLTGHGIQAGFLTELASVARGFFALPLESKLAIEMANSAQFRGYTRSGLEHTRGKPDWREQLDIGVEAPTLPVTPDSPAWTRLQGPNQWPAEVPELRPLALRWQDEGARVLITILRAFALALEQPEDIFEPIYGGAPHQRAKLIRYPGRETTPDDQGVGPHKDSGILTLLHQADRGGLEVDSPNGWIKAEPLPGALVVNIGELLEIASNGYLKATTHRVVTPPSGADRLSFAFFLGARLDSTVPVLPLPPHLAAEAKGTDQDPMNPLFRQVGANYLKGRLRSHPDVARRHYQDLVDPNAPQGPGSAY